MKKDYDDWVLRNILKIEDLKFNHDGFFMSAFLAVYYYPLDISNGKILKFITENEDNLETIVIYDNMIIKVKHIEFNIKEFYSKFFLTLEGFVYDEEDEEILEDDNFVYN